VEVLPIAEVLFGGLEAHAPEIYGYDAKWTPDSASYIGTLRRFGLEQDEPELAKTLKQFALACWTLFGFSGYARVDFRIDPTGAPFIIDVNPNPYLTPDTEDAAAAAEAGLSYQDLIGSIVESAMPPALAFVSGAAQRAEMNDQEPINSQWGSTVEHRGETQMSADPPYPAPAGS
jgi:D-alanine-D-alanine ligase